MLQLHNPVKGRKGVVAIDFGSTFSGFAYSTIADPEDTQWGFNDKKVPTACLFEARSDLANSPYASDFERYELEHFGEDARDEFERICEELEKTSASRHHSPRKMIRQNTGYLFFDHEILKMRIRRWRVGKCMSVDGKRGLDLQVIIAKILQFMGRKALELVKGRTQEHTLGYESILWVITVPATWDEQGKNFMRNAAAMAGLGNDNVILALEPECAALAVLGNPQYLSQLEEDDKVIVADCGGGTVDINLSSISFTDQTSGEQKTKNFSLKALSTPMGSDDGGGSKVEIEFRKFLSKLLGNERLEALKRFPGTYADLMDSEFDRKKRTFKGEQSQLTIGFSDVLQSLYEAGALIPKTTEASEGSDSDEVDLLDSRSDSSGNFSDDDGEVDGDFGSANGSASASASAKGSSATAPRRGEKSRILSMNTHPKRKTKARANTKNKRSGTTQSTDLRRLNRVSSQDTTLSDAYANMIKRYNRNMKDEKLQLGLPGKHRLQLRIGSALMQSFFDPPIQAIVKSIKEALAICATPKFIILAGGFVDSEYVKQQLRTKFADHQIVSPANSIAAVLKGAVLFGWEPLKVQVRVAPFTLGVAITKSIKELSSDVKERVLAHEADSGYIRREVEVEEEEDDDDVLGLELDPSNIFKPLVLKGEKVESDKVVASSPLRPHNRDTDYIQVRFYRSDHSTPPKIVEDADEFLASVYIDVSSLENPDEIIVKVGIGATEIMAFVEGHKVTFEFNNNET